MNSLPVNLLDQILFRLDPRSLAMMECTGRSINSHISDDDLYFKSEYLSRVGAGLLHISSFGSNVLFCYPFGESTSMRNKDYFEVPIKILSSCSGLFLLFINGLCVVNPLTKRYRFVDHCKSTFIRHVDKRGSVRFNLGWHQMNRIGFAVDQIDRTTQRFKVVCMSDTETSNPDETLYQFEITTGDSCWKLSKTTITCSASDLIVDRKAVYVDGSLHWLREDGSILAFNPETEQVRLIPIRFPQRLSSTSLFTAAENELALILGTEEEICVYSLENILNDPKWVLVKRIQNEVVDKESVRYWNVAAYDGKSLVVRQMSKELYQGVVHGYDMRANKWELIGLMPDWCDNYQVFYQLKLSLSSAIELDEKVDVEMMTMVDVDGDGDDDDKRISSLNKIMELIGELSPNALKWLKKKEEETNLKMVMGEPSDKFIHSWRINKGRRPPRIRRRFLRIRR